MNFVLNFLSQSWQRLGLEGRLPESPTKLSSVVATPRFHASAHLIFFVLTAASSKPILVVKVPRLPGDNSRLDKEVANLNAVHAARAGGFDSIPRILAYEDYLGHRLLVETALASPTMRPAVVRRQPRICIEALMNWLLALHTSSARSSSGVEGWFANLVQNPLDEFENWLPVSETETVLIAATRTQAESLLKSPIPLVMEHGDLSSPNILMNEKNQIGVVDWELAEPAGLPVVDLFFFLTYVAFSRKNAGKTSEYISAFRDAFFGSQAWSLPYLQRYGAALHIPAAALRPLFLLCWARYVCGLVRRLKQHEHPQTKLSNEQINWLRLNRYYALWKYAVDHFEELAF